MLSLADDGPLAKLSQDQQTFLIAKVVTPIIAEIEKARMERTRVSPEKGAELEVNVGIRLQELVASYPGATYEYTGDVAGSLGAKTGDHVLTLPVPGNTSVVIAVEDKAQKAMSPKAVKDESNKARENRSAGAVIFIAGEEVLPKVLGRWGRLPEVRNGFYLVYDAADHAMLACTIHMAYLLAVAEMKTASDGARLHGVVEEEIGVLAGIITLCNSLSGQHAVITKAVGEAASALGDIRSVVGTGIERLRVAILQQQS